MIHHIGRVRDKRTNEYKDLLRLQNGGQYVVRNPRSLSAHAFDDNLYELVETASSSAQPRMQLPAPPHRPSMQRSPPLSHSGHSMSMHSRAPRSITAVLPSAVPPPSTSTLAAIEVDANDLVAWLPPTNQFDASAPFVGQARHLHFDLSTASADAVGNATSCLRPFVDETRAWLQLPGANAHPRRGIVTELANIYEQLIAHAIDGVGQRRHLVVSADRQGRVLGASIFSIDAANRAEIIFGATTPKSVLKETTDQFPYHTEAGLQAVRNLVAGRGVRVLATTRSFAAYERAEGRYVGGAAMGLRVYEWAPRYEQQYWWETP